MLLKTATAFSIFLFGLLALFTAPLAAAQPFADGPADEIDDPETFEPNILPALTLPRIATTVKVDGDLDEAAWRGAARALNFSETFPGDQTEPAIDVTAYLTYDDENLYVAYVIEDDPSAIRANLSDRDAIWQDDYVGLILDPNADGQALYFIASNPLGIQGDTRISPKPAWLNTWTAAGASLQTSDATLALY